MEFKTETDSGKEDEVNMEILSATNPEEQEEDGDIVYEIGSNSESKLQYVPEIIKKVSVYTMFYAEVLFV